MDISAALIVYGVMGSKPLRLLQGIAGGVLGPRTFSGGIPTAILGLALHFVIAFAAATVFFLASVQCPSSQSRRISGVLYGIAVYFFMNRVVVPLSRRHQISLLRKNDVHRRHHPHLLCRHSHLSQHSPLRTLIPARLIRQTGRHRRRCSPRLRRATRAV